MDNQYIKDVLAFLYAHPTLDSVNEVILDAENRAKNALAEIEKHSGKLGVVVALNERDTISRYIDNATGIGFLRPSYNSDFNKFTARCSAWYNLYYAVRDTVWDFYSYVQCEVKGDKVKMTPIHLFGDDADKEKYIVREQANGKTVYWYIDELAERIALVKEIENFFEERLNS